jgi:hypothetical protein
MSARIRLVPGVVAIVAILASACSDVATSPTRTARPSAPLASGGSGSGGGGIPGGGGVGGGGGSTAPTTSVVTYSNFGPTDVIPRFVGWGLTGMQTTGFFDDFAEQFVPAASGSITSIRLGIQQGGTGGNGSYTLYLYADNATAPNTIGTLIATFQGQSAKNGATSALSTINVSNGPRLQAGVNYWFKLVPSSESRETWYWGPANVSGTQLYEDPYQQLYSTDAAQAGVQGAFEIRVLP